MDCNVVNLVGVKCAGGSAGDVEMTMGVGGEWWGGGQIMLYEHDNGMWMIRVFWFDWMNAATISI